MLRCSTQSIKDLERLVFSPELNCPCALSIQSCDRASSGSCHLTPWSLPASCSLACTPHPIQRKPSPSAPCLGNQCSWVTYLDGCYGDEVDSFMWHKRRAPLCYIEPAEDRVPVPRAPVSVGREGGSDSPSYPLAPHGGAATRGRRYDCHLERCVGRNRAHLGVTGSSRGHWAMPGDMCGYPNSECAWHVAGGGQRLLRIIRTRVHTENGVHSVPRVVGSWVSPCSAHGCDQHLT